MLLIFGNKNFCGLIVGQSKKTGHINQYN